MDSNSRFRLFSARTANFLDFPFSAGDPVFVDGARLGPPDDVGGTSGFMDFLEAVLDPTHEEHGSMLEWCGGPSDPNDINEKRIRMILSRFAYRRRGPLMSHRNGRRRERQ